MSSQIIFQMFAYGCSTSIISVSIITSRWLRKHYFCCSHIVKLLLN